MNIDIDKYVREHVPYCIEIMLSHEVYRKKYHEKINDNQILRGVFVGSITKGRMLLEVIGIKLHNNGEIQDEPDLKKDKPGEDLDKTPVHSDDIRGKLANVKALKDEFPEDMEKIRHYLVAANKYELHLTKQQHDRDLIKYDDAIPFIKKLVDEHIYLFHSNNRQIREELLQTNRTFAEAFQDR